MQARTTAPVATGSARALDAAAAIVNADPPIGAVREWAGAAGFTPNAEQLARLQRLRCELRTVWSAGALEVVELVNELLASTRAALRLVSVDDAGPQLVLTVPETGNTGDAVLAQITTDIAVALAGLLARGDLDRARVCAAPACRRAYVDLSKNRSRRFCCVTCSNRVSVAAYRARRAEPGGAAARSA